LERIVYNRIINYVDKFDIISDHQYGLRKNHSTSQALLQLYNKISAAIDRKEFTVGIFLDLSKALDTVNHDILFDNLEHYGIRGVALDWMKNSFHNRLQFVQYNDTLSTFKSIRCGVPQSSILGPLLFLLYINDLCDVTNVLEFILFADDTNLFYSHKNQSSLANVINHEIHKLSEWFRANKLSINIKKSNYMLFKPRQKN
jgi:retron-type reverse transcriptase